MGRWTKILTGGVVLVSCLAMVGTAYAGDLCKNFTVSIKNDTDHEIKVTKFEYYDYTKSKWRTEALLGLDGHQKIGSGEKWSKTRGLEHVKNDSTKFKITYSSTKAGAQVFTEQNDKFVCKKDGKRIVRATKVETPPMTKDDRRELKDAKKNGIMLRPTTP